jgi:hypothetical protein
MTLKELSRGKVKFLVYLDGCLMREDVDYVWKDGEPFFQGVDQGRIDIIELPEQANVVTFTLYDPASRTQDQVRRLPTRLVLSNYQVLLDCLRECPYEIMVSDDPKSSMFGFVCVETGDSWLIRTVDMMRTGPDKATTNEFRVALVKSHNELLKKLRDK